MAPSTQLLSGRGAALGSRLLKRGQSSLAKGQIDSSKLEVRVAAPDQLNKKPAVKDLVFGKQFTDHMLRIPWNVEDGWSPPSIVPLEPFPMHPGAKVISRILLWLKDLGFGQSTNRTTHRSHGKE